MSRLCTPERLASTADIKLHHSRTGRSWIIIYFHATNECVSIPISPVTPPLMIIEHKKP